MCSRVRRNSYGTHRRTCRLSRFARDERHASAEHYCAGLRASECHTKRPGPIVDRKTARRTRLRMSVKRIPSMTSQKLAVTRYCWPHERRTTTRIKNCNPSSVLATRWTRPTSLGRRFSASVHSREPGVAPSKSGDLLVGMASVGSRIPQTSEFFDGVQWVDVLCESPRIRPRTT